MKTSKYLKMTSVLLVAALVLCQIPLIANAAIIGRGLQDMVKAEINAHGTAITDDDAYIEYQFLYGDFDGKSMSQFTSFATDDNMNSGEEEPANVVWQWQWRSSSSADTVMKITAKTNMTFLAAQQGDNAGLPGGWASNTSFRFVWENAQGQRVEVKRLQVPAEGTSLTKEETDCLVHLATGDSLYIVYTGGGTTSYCPWFTIDTEAYDAAQRPGLTETVNHVGLMSDSAAANGGAIGKELATYQYLYGSFDGKALSPLESNTADKLSSTDGKAVFEQQQWHCDTDVDAVLKITAKSDVKLDASLLATESGNRIWATGSTFRYVWEGKDGAREQIHTISLANLGEKEMDDHLDLGAVTVHLAAGESLYIVYTAPGFSTSDFKPQFTLTERAYDWTKDLGTVEVDEASVNLEDEVRYHFYYTLNAPADSTISETGLAVYDNAACTGTPTYISGSYSNGSKMYVRSDLIPAKNMGDDLYIRIYAKTGDTYVYSAAKTFSARFYAAAQLNNAGADANLKSLCLALMNYGASAQTYFGYETDNLMNTGLNTEGVTLVEYSADLIDTLGTGTSLDTAYTAKGEAIESRVATIVAGGNLSLNYYITLADDYSGSVTMYYWHEGDTATNSVEMTYDAEKNRYTTSFAVYAKNMGDTLYVAVSLGEDNCTGVIPFSVDKAAEAYLTYGDADLQALAKAMVIYGEHAKTYLNNK